VAARRCSSCGISYPNISQFTTCPIHDELTSYLGNSDADEDWQVNYERLSKQAVRAAEVNERVFPLIRGVSVVEEDGRYFVDNAKLHQAGVRFSRMQPDQFYLFELEDGWIYETQGFDDPRRRWWVDRVAPAEDS
jgi:hypothetical protein